MVVIIVFLRNLIERTLNMAGAQFREEARKGLMRWEPQQISRKLSSQKNLIKNSIFWRHGEFGIACLAQAIDPFESLPPSVIESSSCQPKQFGLASSENVKSKGWDISSWASPLDHTRRFDRSRQGWYSNSWRICVRFIVRTILFTEIVASS